MRDPLVNCGDCGAQLGRGAYKCRCGWKAATLSTVVEERKIACCYADCIEGAICRVWTKTGWANVCKTHYQTIETVVRRSSDPHIQKMREEIQHTLDRRAVAQNLNTLAKQIPVHCETPREPGSDDEYTMLQNELSQVLADRAQA